MKQRIIMVLSVALALVLALPAIAQGPPPAELDGEVVIEGLNGPQGLYVDGEGTLWVVDSGFGGDEEIEYFNPNSYALEAAQLGTTANIARLNDDGETEVVASVPSVAVGTDFLGLGRMVELDGTIYATVGAWHINLGEEVTVPLHGTVVAVEDGEATALADLWSHELEFNPDETTNIETHPYGIAVGNDGLLYVTDAAANALLTVDPATGDVETVVGFEGLPGVFPNPYRDNQTITDPVPTNVVITEDGRIFVSFLSGAPFVPGSAKVVEVMEDGSVTDFAPGLTMLVDLAQGPDGNLYGVQFGMFTQEGPVPNSGSVVRIFDDGSAEVVVEGLPFATAIAFNDAGDAYIAINGIAIPQAGQVLLYEGLTAMEGMPMPAMAPPGADAEMDGEMDGEMSEGEGGE